MTSTGRRSTCPLPWWRCWGTIWVRRLEYLAMMPMTVSTFSSSTPEMRWWLPAIKKAAGGGQFCHGEAFPGSVRQETAPLSSLLTIARINFINNTPFPAVRPMPLFRPIAFPPKGGRLLGLFYHQNRKNTSSFRKIMKSFWKEFFLHHFLPQRNRAHRLGMAIRPFMASPAETPPPRAAGTQAPRRQRRPGRTPSLPVLRSGRTGPPGRSSSRR